MYLLLVAVFGVLWHRSPTSKRCLCVKAVPSSMIIIKAVVIGTIIKSLSESSHLNAAPLLGGEVCISFFSLHVPPESFLFSLVTETMH